MRVLALICVFWLSLARADASNVSPLAFGMTPDEAAAALGVPLAYISGPPRAEIYFADVDAGVPGWFYRVRARLVLQFRNGMLTGWKTDRWLRKPWLF